MVKFLHGGRKHIRGAGRQQAGLEDTAQYDGNNDGGDVRGECGRDDGARHILVCKDKGKMAEGRNRADVPERASVIRHDTAEAMMCQKGFARKITSSKKRNNGYVLAVKGNHPALEQDIMDFFECGDSGRRKIYETLD